MQTDKINIKRDHNGIDHVFRETTRFTAYNHMDNRSALRLRLLVEESLGLVDAITGDYEATIWLENDEDMNCSIHIIVETFMDSEKKKQLINVSSDRKNAARVGFMGKIREVVENYMYTINDVADMQIKSGNMPMIYGSMDMYDLNSSTANSLIYMWSMEKYKENVSENMEEDAQAKEAWDELEKSIIANLADNVRVGVRGDTVEIVVEKKF